jgi:hypothetical protein
MRKSKPIEALLPTIEIEDEQGVGYMVLCWEGGRYDLDEFIYEPGVVYALTERPTKKETFILVVGYEFLPLDQMRRAIEQDNLQVELVIRTVTEKGADLVASSRLTRYQFPACLDHDLSPDRFLVEALEENVVESKGKAIPTLDTPVTLQPAVKIVQNKKKVPIDLTHTNLGSPKKATVEKEVVVKKEAAVRSAIVPTASPKKTIVKTVEETVPVPERVEIVIRMDDLLRVQRVLQHWVDTAQANSDESLKWTIVPLSHNAYQIIRMGYCILTFDRKSRILSTDLTIEQLKFEFELMTNGVMSCQLETSPIHEIARHIFLRSNLFTQSSIKDFLMQMLSIKKVGSYTKTRRKNR